MEILPGDDQGPKHPVLASVLMGIIRALNEDSTGPSSSSDDNVTCLQHDRRQPPCRRRIHQKTSEVETDKAQEYILPPPDECLSPTEAPPTPEPIRSATESPKLHTIVETEEETEDEAKEGEVHPAKDAIKHLQKESVRACSSASSPLVTSDDSDIAAFLSKHEYATLFGAKSGNTDKILIPTRFVQDYGETSTSSQTSSSKRSSEEEINIILSKKQTADHSPVDSPPKTPKRKLESLFDDTEQEFNQSIQKSDQDAGAVSLHDATSMVQDTDVHRETGSSMDSTSQPKRLKTSDEELSKFSSEETLFSESMSLDTFEESADSPIIGDTQAEVLGGRKKKLTKTFKSDPHQMSEFSSDGQTEILKPSMTMPGPKVRLGNYGWAAGRKDAKSMLQKAVSSSLQDLSIEYSESQGKTNTSDTIGSSSSFKSSPGTLSAGDISESKYTSDISDTSFTSSDFKSVTSLVGSPKIQTSDALTERTNKIPDESTHQEYISSMSGSQSTATNTGSSIPTGTDLYSESVVTSSDKLYNDSAKSSEHKSILQSSDVSSKQISPSLEERVTTPATATSISYSSSLSHTSEVNESIEASGFNTMTRSDASYSKESSISTRAKSEETETSPTTPTSASFASSDVSPSNTDASSSDSFVSSLNTTSRSGIDPRDLPTSMRTGTGQPLMNPLDDFYAIPVYSDTTSNTSSNASTHLQDSSKTDVTLNRFQPTSDVTGSGITSTSAESSVLTASEATTLSLSGGGRRSSGVTSTSTESSSPGSSALTSSEAFTSGGRMSKTPSDAISTSIGSSSVESSAVTASEATTLSLSAGGRGSKPPSVLVSTSTTSSSFQSSAVTDSEATTLKESSLGQGQHFSRQSGSFESSKYSSDTTTIKSTSISSKGKSTLLVDEEDSRVPLSNINLTDALLREDPSLSDFDDSDTLTSSSSSSDEYITHKLMQDTPSTHDRGYSKSHLALEAETADLPPTITKTIEPDDKLLAPTDEANEDLFMKDVHGEYLPVLIEDENEERSDGSQTQIDNVDTVDENLVGDVESSHEEETSTLQESSTVVISTVISSSEVSTLTESKTDDDHSDRLLIIDLGDNNKAFGDILITEDPSDPSFLYEIPSVYDDEPENFLQLSSSTSSESKQTKIEYIPINENTVFALSCEVARYVIVNAVATVFTEMVVNIAITRIMVEEDLAFQMERALFPGTGVDDDDEIIHWVAPVRYRPEKYSGPLRDTESSHKQTEDDGETFSLCLERAFFPCLADSEDNSSRVSTSRSDSTYHSLPQANRIRTDEKIESATPRNLITMAYSQVSTVASRVSAIAVSSISQTLGVITFLTLTIWNYICDNFHESRMQGKDEATQYDYTVNMVDEKSGRSQTDMVKEADDAKLNIIASKIVTSAVTKAAWGKEYAMSEQSFPRETLSFTSSDMVVACESDTSIVQFASNVVGDVFRGISEETETRADQLTTTPPMVLAAKKSEEDYNIRLSASSVVETAVANALVIHDYIKESPTTTPSVLSIQSEHKSVSSGRSIVGDDVSACSLSDIPLSSITFMRQQLADMRAIFKDTLTGTIAEVGSAPHLTLMSTAGEDLKGSLQVSSALPLDAEDESSAVGESVIGLEEETVEERNKESESSTSSVSALSLSDVPFSGISYIREQLAIVKTLAHSIMTDSNMPPPSGDGVEQYEKSQEVGTEIIDSALENKQDEQNLSDEAADRIKKIDKLLPGLSASEQKEEEAMDPKDPQDSDSSTSSVSALSLSDVPLSGISYIREQLANVKTLANSIMTDSNIPPPPGDGVEPYEKSQEVGTEIIDSALENRQDEPSVSDEAADRIDKSDKLLPKSEQKDEETVNPKDEQDSDSSTSSVSALSLSDVPLSGISYIREQLANVKTLAHSIMADFDSYAEERTLVAKRSSLLTCSSASGRSLSSCDSARTIGNNSSNSLTSLNLQGESKFNEVRNSSSDKVNNLLHKDTHVPADDLVHQVKYEISPQISEALGRGNENGNAKTHINDQRAQSDSKKEMKLQLTNDADGILDCKTQRQAKGKAMKENMFESSHITNEADRTRTVQMTETHHQTRQMATFSRNSPSRRHVNSRRKGADHSRGSYSGESTCSTDCSSSIVSTSSFSDGAVSSEQSKKVTIESESQGKGRTDVSCRISDRGIWVNTAFLNEIDDDDRNTPIAADNENKSDKFVKNKIQINVKMSPSSRKKHHSHRSRSRGRDTQLHGTAVANHRALTILDNETLVKNCQELRVDEMSMKTRADDSRTARRQAYDEVTEGNEYQGQSNKSSFKHEVSDMHDHRAMDLLNKDRPKKNSSLETQCSDMSEKTEEVINLPASQIHTKRECLSDGAVSERHQCVCRKQGSMRRKTRETKPQESSACHSCEAHPEDILAAPVISRSEGTRAVLSMLDDVAENLSIDPPARNGSMRRKSRDTRPQESSACHSCEAHPDDILAAPVISRSERTRAVLSMLDDVADNLSIDPPSHINAGGTNLRGSFRKLFASRKNKQRSREKTPEPRSPRVLSDSSVTESDSGSPDYSSDSSRTPRSHSAASLLSNVLRNMSAKRSKRKLKDASPKTPNGSRARKGSVPAFDEMLGDLDDDCFIDDAFPKLISTRDSPSEDNTSLNEVLQDLIEEWSFEGLEKTFNFTPRSFVERIREKLNLFMEEVRKEKRKVELRFGRDGS